MAHQLSLLVDLNAYDVERGRKIRHSRHVGVDGKLACGHKGIPADGEYRQEVISFRALLQVTECPVCQKYLKAQAAYKVIRRGK